ncbi:unnamed protein product [Victoria cruziana]
MEEGAAVAKHVLLAKFKDEIPQQRIEQLIRDYAALVPLIPSMKAFHWGRDVSIENVHQGFTHIFESTFESTEGIAEYVSHPVHVDFAKEFVPALEKFIVVDYKPVAVKL